MALHFIEPKKMNFSLKSNLFTPLLISLTLGLAPFTPELHLFGKIRWILGGGGGMAAMDIFALTRSCLRVPRAMTAAEAKGSKRTIQASVKAPVMTD